MLERRKKRGKGLQKTFKKFPLHKPLADIAFLYKKLYFLQEDEIMYGLVQQLFLARLFSIVTKRDGWIDLGPPNLVTWDNKILFVQVIPFKVDFAFPESFFEFWNFRDRETKLFSTLFLSFTRSSFFWTIPEHIDFVFFDLSIFLYRLDCWTMRVGSIFDFPGKRSFWHNFVFDARSRFRVVESKLFLEHDFVYLLFFGSSDYKYLCIYSQYLFDYPVLGLYLDDYLFRYAVWYDYCDDAALLT